MFTQNMQDRKTLTRVTKKKLRLNLQLFVLTNNFWDYILFTSKMLVPAEGFIKLS